MDGTPLARYRAYEDALGVKSVAWAPSGQLLAVGSYDQARRCTSRRCSAPSGDNMPA